jgi:hypothetical protein
MHPDSDCNILDMVGKIRRLYNHLTMHSESMRIIETSQRLDFVLVLQQRLLDRWAVVGGLRLLKILKNMI